MSDLLTDTDFAPTIKKPEAWKNRWFFKEDMYVYCMYCGQMEIINAGEDRVTCCKTWPSKEEAEASTKGPKSKGIVYIGAVKVEIS